ncbi:hypothetical protein PoB_002637200 [Plakobranchus ocellatus]|uniref:SMB domain-containing protein n=1 Tax=Plakobranchus ocellatus TaxID=259542 RepID=A0AAV3ZYV9_9GAST|nr:hypothetical protein PoB_002637200 [Plakobranchus ocellatus]
MEFYMHRHPLEISLLVLITVASFLVLSCTTLRPVDAPNAPNGTNGTVTVMLATSSSANKTDFKTIKSLPFTKRNRMSFEGSSDNVTRPPSGESKRIKSCLVKIQANESLKQSKLLFRDKDSFLENGQALDLEKSKNEPQETQTNIIVDTVGSTSDFLASALPNITTEKFEEPNDINKFEFSSMSDSNLQEYSLSLTSGKSLMLLHFQEKFNDTPKLTGYKNGTNNDDTRKLTTMRGYSLKNESSENTTDYRGANDTPASLQEYILNKNISEAKTDCGGTEILTSIPENPHRLGKSRNETEYDCTEEMVSPQTESLNVRSTLNDNNAEILRATELHRLNETSFSPNQVTPSTVLTDFGEIDMALTFTCQGRCGVKISFPCSCSATCVVYGTCCDNMAQDCPHEWQGGLTRFNRIRSASAICSKYSIYMISSCPSPDKESTEREVIDPTVTTNKAVLGSENENWFELDVGIPPGSEDSVTFDSTSFPNSDRDPQDSILQRLHKALSLAPVSDLSTGFTFSSKAIYDCHNMSEDTALTWSLRLEYDFISPTKLEEFDHHTLFDEYRPDFNTQIFKDHLCLDHIDECNQSAPLEERNQIFIEKCRKSTAIVIFYESELPTVFYKNRFCAFCNEGKHDGYKLFLQNITPFKRLELMLLMSLSESKTFRVKLRKPGYTPTHLKLPWSHAECSVPSQVSISSTELSVGQEDPESQARSVCTVSCEHPSFTVRSDGHCKAQHEALVAIADDGLSPLCPAAMTSMAKFFVCGLQSEIEHLRNSDLSSPSVTAMFDSTTNRSLYVVKLYLALPEASTLFFSNAVNDVFINLQYVALLAKSFKEYRMYGNLCSETTTEVQNTGVRVIRTSSFLDLMAAVGIEVSLSQGMEELRGPILDNQTTTTVCLSVVSTGRAVLPDHLRCIDDPVYERDAAWLCKHRISPCFSQLSLPQPVGYNGATFAILGSLGILTMLLNILIALKTTEDINIDLIIRSFY